MRRWRPVNGYESLYEISDSGELRRPDGNMVRGSFNRHGQLVYLLSKVATELKYASRLVAEHFLENPHGLRYVVHIDGNKKNNHVNNLKWHHSPVNSRIDVEAIRHIKSSTMSAKDLSEIYGVSESAIYKIKNRKI